MTRARPVPSEAELRSAYCGRRVLLTGHTGFKGGWLALWLKSLGAEVSGYALPPRTQPSLFEAAGIAKACRHLVGDLRDPTHLRATLRECQPEVVFHLAAQPLVRRSYEVPMETIETNVLGTAHLLEVLRLERQRCALVVVTSDKCYENREWAFGYREQDALGGHDVYSMSKAAAELVVSSYRRSFFLPARLAEHGVALASARAGNVIGGGDWSEERLVPDAVSALAAGRPIPVRNPAAVRPWQHVLEPLGGYLLLGARLAGVGTERPADFCEAWNFGPRLEDARPVRELVEGLLEAWGEGSWEDRHDPGAPHEAGLLRLSTEKAHGRLGWLPRWDFQETVRRTVDWYRAFYRGASVDRMRNLCLEQIHAFMEP